MIIEQVLKALYYMYNENNMIHCNLTPYNILFVNNDNFDIKIDGFIGNKHTLKINNESSNYYYKSPEIFSNNKYSHSSDLFAVGIITFLLIFGFPPFFDPKYGYNHYGDHEIKSIQKRVCDGFKNRIRCTNKYGKGGWRGIPLTPIDKDDDDLDNEQECPLNV